MPLPPVINLSDLDGSNGFVINGIDASDFSGISVSDIGDVNGDGIDDILIGAYYADPNGQSNAGESYVVFGSNAGFGASLDLSSLDGSNGFVINGIDATDFSGRSVSGAGDVNGDGIDDFIIGASSADPNGTTAAGESYVVFGSSTGFGASLNLSSLNGTNGFVINGKNAGDNSGASVSGAGDVNGDGIDDVIVGAFYGDPNGQSSAGESYVVFGSNAGFAASFNLSSLDGTNGFVINGIDANDYSGVSVSGAGDVNGDGIDDIIIGAYQADPNGTAAAGESYVVFGSNGGFGASLNPSSLDGTNGFVINGIDGYDLSGYSVSGAGDVNGDGIDDILIGARTASPNSKAEAGESYVVFGSNAGFGASLNLSALDGTNGFVINGIDANDLSGFSVSGAGDVNGDGIDDVIIGAYRADPNGDSSAGESYIVFGSNVGFGASLNLSALDGTNGIIINGIDATDYSGYSVSGAGDVNGDGVDDILIGAVLADPNGNSDAGESYIIFGVAAPPPPAGPTTGADTLSGDAGDNTVTFDTTTLNDGDSYDGLGGTDTVQLAGGGTFDFTGVTLTNVEAISTDGTDTTLHFTDASYLSLLTSLGGSNDRVEVEGFAPGTFGIPALFDVFDAGAEELGFATADFAVEGTYDGGDDLLTLVYTDSSAGGSGSLYTSQTRTYERDGSLSELVSVYDNGRVATNTFNSEGQRTGYTIELANGTVTSATIDPATGNLLTSSSTRADGVTVSIGFDGSGNRTSRTITDNNDTLPFQSQSFGYDASGTLTYTAKLDDNGNQYAFGYAGSQTFQDTAGVDTFSGGAGDDLFVFDDAMGIDRISDFAQGDLLDLTAIGIDSRDDLDAIPGAIYQQGNHVVIDYSLIDPNHSGLLYLFNTDLTDVDNSDFAGSAG